MLPLLCVSALYFHHWRVDRHLRTGLLWTAMLWFASILMIAAGTFELTTRLQSLRTVVSPPSTVPADAVLEAGE